MSLYQVIAEANPNRQNIVLKGLDGNAQGQTALLTDGKLVWESSEGGYFSTYREEVEKIDESGVIHMDGASVFSELLGKEKKFVICGGGHVSMPIIKMGNMIGCKTIVLEDRPKFADNARRAGANEVICEPFDQGLEKIEGDEDTFFIIVTRGHRYDQMCLEHIVKKKHAYIGMIGSKRRVIMVKKELLERGADPDIIEQVHSPIGLDIGAETPEEIAVAILAEIIEVKNKKMKQSCEYPKEMLNAILYDVKQEKKILATIIYKNGSAPRGTGTKMLICADGNCIGTIGGGCAESNILQKALLMLRMDETGMKKYRVDMSGNDAEEDGMVCGGVIEVLLEVIG